MRTDIQIVTSIPTSIFNTIVESIKSTFGQLFFFFFAQHLNCVPLTFGFDQFERFFAF